MSALRGVVPIHFVDLDEVFQEERNHELIDAAERADGLLGAGLDESRNPFHEWLAYECVFSPAVQVNETADLTARDERQQIHAVGEPDAPDGEEEFLKRGRPDNLQRIRTG